MAHRLRFLIVAVVIFGLAAALALIATGGQPSLAVDGIIYVDADATGSSTGGDWTNAYTDLQEALTQAGIGDQIWVAAGTYKPTDGDDRTVSFAMKSNVGIYGGFDPSVGATEWADRNWETHVTILSGNIGDEGTNADNSYHVFYHPGGLDSSAILDGFTITGGNANGDSPHNDGGGMYNYNSSSPTLTNCTFTGNSAAWGGGLYSLSSSPTLTNCTFAGNSVDYDGGGMYNSNSSLTLSNCTFEGNSATNGGGIYNSNSSPMLTDCTFSSNTATPSGGAPIGVGGGMYNYQSSPTLINCIFLGNSAVASLIGGGSAMHNTSSSPELTNCTFWGNSMDYSGGAIYNELGSSPMLTNCILWGDIPNEISGDGFLSSTPVVAYSDVQGGCENIPGSNCGDGNINADPLFLDAAGGDLHMQSTSPAIDAGNNDAVPATVTTDLDGNPRFTDIVSVPDTGHGDPPIVDMGAYEVLPDIIYVDRDASGANDGNSWLNAYVDLQDALDEASSLDQIWVAAGVYTPTWKFNAEDPRSATFQMANGVAIYGGFAGGETEREQRNWEANPTILSGDLNGDDEPDFANNADNSYHVFYHPDGTDLDGTAILDGFTITGGNANGVGEPHTAGGGMFNDSSSPSLVNCTFADNSAYEIGGGMLNLGSSPTLTNCTFIGNSATSDGGGMENVSSSPLLINCTFTGNSALIGGGMANYQSSTPVLTHCTFTGNVAEYGGGGIYNSFSSPALTHCTFTGNVAEYGGGVENFNNSSPTLTNCTFYDNEATDSGGGMYNSNSSPTLTNCTLTGNSAVYNGGGMRNAASSPTLTGCTFGGNSADYGAGMYNYFSSPTLTNCTFSRNWADSFGGGIYNDYSSPALINCTFSGNSAGEYGGGVYNHYSPSTLTNCTFSGNEATNDGGGIYNYKSSPTLTNCILWGDTAGGFPDEIANDSSTPLATYSDIQGGYAGEGNIDANPLFLDPGSGDYHLGPGSPCIDAGTNDAPYLPEYDFEGDPRIFDGDHDGTPVVDVGVEEWYETPPNPIYVDLEATGADDGSSWGDALTNLQAAVNWAQEGGEVWVAQGVYTPVWRFDSLDPRSASFRMKNGVAIYGGFSGAETEREQRNWVANPTSLSGDLLGDDGPGFANTGENSYHVFYHPDGTSLDGTAVLDGFIITGGYADGAPWPHNEGGGMFNSASSPTLANLTFAANWASHGGGMYNIYNASPALTNCTFSGNVADILGGGMFNTDSSSPTLVDCTFINNQAGEDGGGMFNNVSSSPELTDCIFDGNEAGVSGGGIYNYQSSPALTNCAFTHNIAVAGYGGGMNCDNSSPVLTNCTFARNHAAVRGGGLSNGYNSSPTLTNCTFYGNEATDSGGGIYNYQSSPVLTNCILWGDTAGALPYEILNVSSSPGVTYCDIQGGYGGEGNINADPFFVDAASGDLHLMPGSPCIDAGSNGALNLPPYDFEGDARIIDGDSDGVAIVDMGVDETLLRVYLPVVLKGY